MSLDERFQAAREVVEKLPKDGIIFSHIMNFGYIISISI